MTELPTEPVQRLIGKYEQRISKLEEVNGKLCEEINRQEKVIEQQRKDYGELAQINHRLSERIANSDVDNVLSLLDEMNEQGRIEYADYSQLHDAIAATLGASNESVRTLINDMLDFIGNCCNTTLDCACCDPVDCKYLDGDGELAECTRYQDFISRAKAIADELNAAMGGEECEWELEHSGTLYDKWRCSECKFLFVEPRCDQGYTDLVPNFCPNCGKAVKR